MSIKGVNFQLSATNNAQAAFDSFNRSLKVVNQNVASTGPLMRSMNAGMNSNRRAVQQLGFQMSDFAVQIAGGQSAMLAFTQQGGQILQFFGPVGAVMAALLAVFGSLYIAMTKTGTAIDQLYPYLGVLEQEFRGVVGVMGTVIDFAAWMGRTLIDNLDQVIITVAVAAGYFGTKLVASMVAATAATWTLTGALVALRVALIRTGIGAVIVLAGYLIERFLTLTRGVGGFGNAIKLVYDVARSVFMSIGDLTVGLGTQFVAMAAKLDQAVIGAIVHILSAFMEMTWQIAEGLNSMFDTDIFKGAKMGMEIGALMGVAEGFGETATAAGAAAEAAFGRATAAIKPAWDALQNGIRAGETGRPNVDFGGGAGAGGAGGGGGGSGGKSDAVIRVERDAEKIKGVFEDLQQSISSSMLEGFKALTKGTKSFAEAATDMLSSVADKIIDILMTPVLDGLAGILSRGIIGGLGGLGANLIGGTAAAGMVNSTLGQNAGFMNLFKSFDGGGPTWTGPRAGGLDGKGGRLALLHSDETVVDHRRGQGVGGGVTNVTMNITTPDAESFRKSQSQIKAELHRMVQQGARGN